MASSTDSFTGVIVPVTVGVIVPVTVGVIVPFVFAWFVFVVLTGVVVRSVMITFFEGVGCTPPATSSE